MGTIISILIFIGLMFVMSKFGIGCCGGHSGHKHHSGSKNLEGSEFVGSEKKQISKNDLE